MDKKGTTNVDKKTDLNNKPTGRITRSQNVLGTDNLSQPSVTKNEPGRMRTRSQSSDKSENLSKSRKNLDTTHDATMDVTVSLLNMNIDENKKYIISPSGKKDNNNTHGDNTPTISKRKRRDSKEDTTDDVSKNKRQKKKSTEENKKQNHPKSDTDIHNLDEVKLVNSDNASKGETSENSATTPTPTPNRMRTRSAKSTDGEPSRKTSSQKTQVPDKNTKTNEVDDDVFQCQICNKTFTDFVQIKQHKIACTRIKKKYVCPKCNKGFDQKTHYQQHFDYRHTNKKPQFVCEPCKKTFELKKMWEEHNRRLHNTDDYIPV